MTWWMWLIVTLMSLISSNIFAYLSDNSKVKYNPSKGLSKNLSHKIFFVVNIFSNIMFLYSFLSVIYKLVGYNNGLVVDLCSIGVAITILTISDKIREKLTTNNQN